MNNLKNIYLGKTLINFDNENIKGEEVVINNENFYKISNVDSMRPFFMSIVSPYNHWLFISSNGALSSGRKDNDNALFPYYTDDKITESHDITGSKTIIHVEENLSSFLWEPFKVQTASPYKISRNLYKNLRGTKIIFEEVNHELGLNFSYQWNISDKYGFIKKSKLENFGDKNLSIRLLDGIQNILPWGVEFYTQNTTSNLVDAYKRSELTKNSGIGIFAMSAILVDKAEPSEARKSNIAWSLGLHDSKTLLSSSQINSFRETGNVKEEFDVKGEKGAYFINSSFILNSNHCENWIIGADVNKDASNILSFQKEMISNSDLIADIEADIQLASDELYKLTGSSDGLQTTSDKRRNIRHFSNTLFNIMRGGIFDNDYQIDLDDFLIYLMKANISVYERFHTDIKKLGNQFLLSDLRSYMNENNCSNLIRLSGEYLPLKFSRRHGDPSRPWNQFSINTADENDGSKILDYEGNWRDIFQNWEALAHSYPQFIDNMILKFLNASTFDGYNPYRVTKDGFDWETIEPDNPWSYIGYWGDHQIIYLLKFLEFIEDYFPEKINKYFDKDIFVYANVPYKIKPYKDILKDPKNTIDFNHESEEKILLAKQKIGADGALLHDHNNEMVKVNFIEKILATLLAKISNFIPGAGIWMNTQRPEWNDANNALVGNGVSMVTLYYLRRFLCFFNGIVKNSNLNSVQISLEQKEFLISIHSSLNESLFILDKKTIDGADRKILMDKLGSASSRFRENIYESNFSGKKSNIDTKDLTAFNEVVIKFLEHSININLRDDGLYHSYNLIDITNKNVSVSHLPEMLEGQVAILSSKYLCTDSSLSVLDSLKASKLFREDQYSYLLYPNKDLPGFLEKNVISVEDVKKSSLFLSLLEDKNNQIILQDCEGGYHFNGSFNNANSLIDEISKLPKKYEKLIKADKKIALDIFEKVFDHKSFTGRSGTFYGYEGLGSIYWHMVSKLLLAVLEVTRVSIYDGSSDKTIGRLFDHYFEINEGIGVNKSPDLYGGFPTDPYSHTPFGRGVQQPGMTGQVKEDILSRFGEMGILVEGGLLKFQPTIMKQDEFLREDRTFKYIDQDHEINSIELNKGMLGFTVCQVPVIYNSSDENKILLLLHDGSEEVIKGTSLNLKYSESIFNRDNQVKRINVYLDRRGK